MKVCLIGWYDAGQYGLRNIEATLEEAGHEVSIIVFQVYNHWRPQIPTKKEYDLLLELVRTMQPDLIGLSVRSLHVWLANAVTDLLRPLGIPIVWGGFHTVVAPEYSIAKPDMVLRGEADRSVVQLAEVLATGGNKSTVPGLWWKEADEIHKNPIGRIEHNLDSLPPIIHRNERRWLIVNDRVYDGEPLLNGRDIWYYILATRGCPHNCSFCGNSSLPQAQGPDARRLRFRSPKKIVEEAVAFREKFGRLDNVLFIDAFFGARMSWLEEFADLWAKEFNLFFKIEIHPTIINDKAVALLRKMGRPYLSIGVQSGSENFRRAVYHRSEKNETILKAAEVLHKNDIPTRWEFIWDNPLETSKDLKETLDFLLELPRPYMTIFSRLLHLPGTPLTDRLLEEGIITKNDVYGFSDTGGDRLDMFVALNKKGLEEYYFYILLIIISQFNYYSHEPSEPPLLPQFYPRWFVRFLENLEFLKRKPVLMFKLADKLGKFAHFTWYYTSGLPKKWIIRMKTAIKMLATGDFQGLLKKTVQLIARSDSKVSEVP